MVFTFRQLQVFVAAAELGSISRAAKALSIPRSSVPEAIQLLERDPDVALFDRRARGITLTHRGSAFLRHAHLIRTDVATAATPSDLASRPPIA
ncbi:regulatory helix-turn-helix protein, lysR family [Loktanella atrilutea]|uniref:Regulatory helix-turn-helix protein, lysR family n=1 Tax=Loktanella atrilutea TaxID=366533 RepID=A0A1M5BIE5_LOKAT|nr:LysR family transcriptional regulator [Loktanella atrilutea]SHF42235.1 regulatory helix-turn-helix protein, lysR family [Loktanella atrilutea]